MAPICTRHASVTGRLYKLLTLSRMCWCSSPRDDDYIHAHPRAQDVLLLIEVAIRELFVHPTAASFPRF